MPNRSKMDAAKDVISLIAEIEFLVLAAYSTFRTGQFNYEGFGLGFGVYLLGKGAGLGIQSFGLPFSSPIALTGSNPDITPPPGG